MQLTKSSGNSSIAPERFSTIFFQSFYQVQGMILMQVWIYDILPLDNLPSGESIIVTFPGMTILRRFSW
ncbi:MAG: hypothetical protein AMDU5_GPLC00004G0354 [Thermoplasmatales archaeon Gpl]|jgi:hypothetical protein|nr:MAG: hypothetical protein AMDU5_GPLC00004G0354 [Thermoplasmatales archaeon Gpl]